MHVPAYFSVCACEGGRPGNEARVSVLGYTSLIHNHFARMVLIVYMIVPSYAFTETYILMFDLDVYKKVHILANSYKDCYLSE